MLVIKPSTKVLNNGIQELDPLKFLESVARVCYKSEDRITETSHKAMLNALIKSNHTAMMEHFSFVFEVTEEHFNSLKEARDRNGNNFLKFSSDSRYLVSGNVRALNDLGDPLLLLALKENYPTLVYTEIKEDYKDIPVTFIENIFDLEVVTPEEIKSHAYVTVKFTVDRGVTHEIVRHRPASYAQESTRYCNYSKDKFNNQLTFIEPMFWTSYHKEFYIWAESMKKAEECYFNLLDKGATPQEARSVLPNSIKTELVMTANIAEWQVFMSLRTPKDAHPQMREVTIPLYKEFFSQIYRDHFLPLKEEK